MSTVNLNVKRPPPNVANAAGRFAAMMICPMPVLIPGVVFLYLGYRRDARNRRRRDDDFDDYDNDDGDR